MRQRLIRNLFSTVSKAPKDPQAFSKPVFETKWQQILYITPYALSIAQQLELYIEKQDVKQRLNIKLLTTKYSIYCLHIWLLKNRLKKISWSSFSDKVQAIITDRSLNRILVEFTRDHVYQYSEYFDRSVYEELNRIKGAIFWSLDDYFEYNFGQKSLGQIVYEDLGYINQNIDKDSLKQQNSQSEVVMYIQNQMKLLDQYSCEQMLSYRIDWGHLPSK